MNVTKQIHRDGEGLSITVYADGDDVYSIQFEIDYDNLQDEDDWYVVAPDEYYADRFHALLELAGKDIFPFPARRSMWGGGYTVDIDE